MYRRTADGQWYVRMRYGNDGIDLSELLERCGWIGVRFRVFMESKLQWAWALHGRRGMRVQRRVGRRLVRRVRVRVYRGGLPAQV